MSLQRDNSRWRPTADCFYSCCFSPPLTFNLFVGTSELHFLFVSGCNPPPPEYLNSEKVCETRICLTGLTGDKSFTDVVTCCRPERESRTKLRNRKFWSWFVFFFSIKELCLVPIIEDQRHAGMGLSLW